MSTAVIPDDAPASARRTNPYVGPRAFRFGERLYGRAREIGDLCNLLIAERIVLLYSPSGAGKSSLLEAGLRPRLREHDFAVFPTIRVSHPPPPHLEGSQIRNRYVLSMLLSLEEGHAPAHQAPPDQLAAIHIAEYLQRFDDELAPGADPCLLFDQFEELFTLDPTDQPDKAQFLEELGVALRARGRWALFAMREDYIAQLDPYVAFMPTRFTGRYRLDLLHPIAAKLAAQAPARAEEVEFTDAAADRLVDDLRKVKVQRGVTVSEDLGDSVEPVQLQVVCRQLWEILPSDATTLEVEDVAALGDVDNALADFYVDQVGAVAASTGVGEREIRDWFDESLITAHGFRAQALDGPGPTGSAVLAELEDAHLIRADPRRGARWYELAHDRLVEPIRRSNHAWREEHLSPLQREAQAWDQHSRPPGLLMTGQVLTDAQIWATDHPGDLSGLDHEYLDACRGEARRAERERRAARRNLRLAVLATIVGLIAIIGLLAAVVAWIHATDQKRLARSAEASALAGQAGLLAATDPPAALALAAEANERRASALTTRTLGDTYNAFVRSGILHTLSGHDDTVSSVAFSPDGKVLASGSDDGTVKLWDPAAGREQRTISGHEDTSVAVVAFSPNGSTLAAAGDDGTVILWNMGNDAEPIRLAGDAKELFGMAFSADGSMLATASEDGTVKLWDPVKGRLTRTLSGHDGRVRAVAFSPTGSLLASAGADRTVKLWDPSTGRELGLLIGHTAPVLSVAFSRDGSLLASGSGDRTVKLWDPKTGQELQTLTGHTDGVNGLAFSPVGSLMASASGDRTIKLWDPMSGRELRTLAGHAEGVQGLAFNQDGSLLASASDDKTIRLWNPTATSELRTLDGHSARVAALAFSPTGSVLASGSDDQTIKLWDFKSGRELQTLTGHNDRVNGVAFSGDGSLLASASGDHTVKLWDPSNGRELRTLTGHTKGVLGVAFNRDASLLASASGDHTVKLWDPSNGRELRTLSGHAQAVVAVAFSPDGSMLASASEDKTVKLWKVDGGRPRTLKGHDDGVTSLAFSEDGSMLATASDDGTVKLWDPVDGRELRTLTGHGDAVSGVAFDPGQPMLAFAVADSTVSLDDPATGFELRTLIGHDRRVLAVAFSPDGSVLASAGADTTIRLWTPDVVTASEACELAQPHTTLKRLQEALEGAEPKACTNLK